MAQVRVTIPRGDNEPPFFNTTVELVDNTASLPTFNDGELFIPPMNVTYLPDMTGGGTTTTDTGTSGTTTTP